MRIIGGKLSGRVLAAPAGRAIRPTSDRVREAIFNKLEHGIADFEVGNARVLDLFAGTGALGLEALSRGARSCLFIDEAPQARGLIRRNADSLGLIGRCKIWRRDASRLGPCAPQPPYELVFADPPYGKNLGEAALLSLVEGAWLADKAVVVLEQEERESPALPPALLTIDERLYGETKILFLRQAAFGSLSPPE